ncbi:hypothetical protein SAMN06297280_0630 [Arsukibacterium tuosuense]|uniref:Cobalt transporter n=1 Tax=Arsukibacterium tuosuense TaxID=1323745 RepID=A0A285I6S0_9GAMM|nr:cobalt transporter [Arsukibacterium tuosuense]SNY43705.1 hypothetical protein SAMN06297280_0630 [Arsukibacterium tuosuense]
MSGRTSGVLLLLLIMLNHAVMACDALVVHMPEHDHSITRPTANHLTPGGADCTHHVSMSDTEPASAQSSEHSPEHSPEQHSEHAHVTCYISFFFGIELLNFTNSVIASINPMLNLISYSPPVPPPNA